MNDSPISTRRSFFAVEANDARMPHPPTQAPPALPEDVAMQVAELAQVPVGEIPLFCDAICATVQRVWETDRRAVSSRPGRALLRAAEAARTFNEAICSLNKDDREWVERLMARPEYQDLPRDFIVTVSQIDDLFSTAVGSSIPPMPGTAALREKRGRPKGSFKDRMFEVFIRHILLFTDENGGELTFDKNFHKGTLVDVLNILRPRLPRGIVPNALPYGTIQKIKTKYLKDRRRFLGPLTIDNWRPQ
jgi:hypothetical protein